MRTLQRAKRILLRSVFAATPATSAYRFRSTLLAHLGHEVGIGVRVVSSTRILGPRVSFGDHAFVGHQVLITGGIESHVAIGSRVDVGPGAKFLAGSHEIGPHEHRAGKDVANDIRVEDGCWIGAGALIVGPVTIGSGSIVAAGAVVVDDVEPDCLVAGSPARLKRRLSPGL